MPDISRRHLLSTAAALGVAASLPSPMLANTQARFVRKNAFSPDAIPDLESYRRAVEAMLNLPPDHPHNWYRYAMIHMSDCPHGNWWFFAWHRPFIGYFEQIIREYSGDSNFALPYWDWSAEPKIPPQFFVTPSDPDNPLDPTSGHYYETQADFAADFEQIVKALYASYTPAQKAQLTLRGYPDAASYWASYNNGALEDGILANIATNRSLNRWNTADYKIDYQNPDLVDLTAQQTPWGRPVPAKTNVEPSKIRTGIKAPDFAMPASGASQSVYFNSPISANHHMFTGSAEIEGFPHNTTHNFLGNAMQSLMSPVDPIFFLHHCNVDRLWDVWEQRQRNLGLSTQPLTGDQQAFYSEEFLFYIDVAGQPVTGRTTARDAMEITPFDYSYTPGTGSELIGAPLSRVVAANFTAVEEAAPIAAGSVSLAKGALNPALTEELALTANSLTNEGLPNAEAARDYLATVTFIPPASAGSLVYELYVAPGNSEAVPGNADTVLGGTFEFFGMRGAKHSHHADPLHITYNITDAVQALNGQGLLEKDTELSFAMVTQSNEVGGLEAAAEATQMRDGQLLGVSVASI